MNVVIANERERVSEQGTHIRLLSSSRPPRYYHYRLLLPRPGGGGLYEARR